MTASAEASTPNPAPLPSPSCLPTATTESLPTTTADSLVLSIAGIEMAECTKTSTIGQDQGTDTEEADHPANDTHLLRMVNHK